MYPVCDWWVGGWDTVTVFCSGVQCWCSDGRRKLTALEEERCCLGRSTQNMCSSALYYTCISIHLGREIINDLMYMFVAYDGLADDIYLLISIHLNTVVVLYYRDDGASWPGIRSG